MIFGKLSLNQDRIFIDRYIVHINSNHPLQMYHLLFFFFPKIRNMVGTLIAAGNGIINQRNIYEMLTIPSKHSWDYRIQTAPSFGLYLTSVEYPAEILQNYIQTIHKSEEALKIEDTQ